MRKRAQEFQDNPELVAISSTEGGRRRARRRAQTLDEVRRAMHLRPHD